MRNCCRNCSRWSAGAAPPSTSPCVFSRKIPGNDSSDCARRCRTCCCRCCCAPRMRSVTPIIPTIRCAISCARRLPAASTCSASLIRSTGSTTCAWRSTRCLSPASSARPRSATPAISPARRSASTRSTTTCSSGASSRPPARTCSASRTWRACASRNRRTDWSRRCARRPACRCTSIRTTPAASARPACSPRWPPAPMRSMRRWTP